MTINFEAILYVCTYLFLAASLMGIIEQTCWRNKKWFYALLSILFVPIFLGYWAGDLFYKAYRKIFKF